MKWNKVCCVIGSVAFFATTTVGCDSDTNTQCGPGTQLVGGECVIAEDGGQSDAAMDAQVATCGEHTFSVDGVCKGIQSVGGACTAGSQCDTETCLKDEDGFPGGYCSIPLCNELRPCTTGSHCVYSAVRKRSICLAFCSGSSECRDGYVCQPIYGTDINVCSPNCSGSNNCPDQTYCDEESGKCVLRECDPTQSSSNCGDGRICYPDPRNLTTQGGLCLSSCDPSADPKTCQGEDVCQPLPEDPAHKGICAPPVCKQTSDCSVGAVCMNNVCQPPARCDDQGGCSDDNTACVGGPGGQCMPKCSDDDACSAIHGGLVCASGVASDKVCLPVGSFPGSACRSDKNSQCDTVKVGNSSAAMVCENDSCLVECGTGGDALCKALSSTLNCASGVFDRAVCLPSGAYPGGPCGGGNHDQCSDANLGSGTSAKMICKGGQCLLDCGSAAIGGSNAEAYCSGIDDSLTCASTVYPGSSVCLPQGSYPGGPCSHGTCSKLGDKTMACEDNTCLVTCDPSNDSCASVDPSLVCAHGIFAQDVCLPKGSFPGGACGANDSCAENLNGVDELDMQCESGICVIGCDEAGKWPGFGDALCTFADPTLTCATAAGAVCVKACEGGACGTGYSCFASENACLPNGSFPGSNCAPNDTCGAGPGGTTMSCQSGKCAVNCTPGGGTGDGICQAVSSALTCFESPASSTTKFCVPACVSNMCSTGYSCLQSQNSCLPDGSFLGSKCAAGSCASNSTPALVCVPGMTPTCAADCSAAFANGQSAADAYCTQVGTATGAGFTQCVNPGGSLRICST